MCSECGKFLKINHGKFAHTVIKELKESVNWTSQCCMFSAKETNTESLFLYTHTDSICDSSCSCSQLPVSKSYIHLTFVNNSGKVEDSFVYFETGNYYVLLIFSLIYVYVSLWNIIPFNTNGQMNVDIHFDHYKT